MTRTGEQAGNQTDGRDSHPVESAAHDRRLIAIYDMDKTITRRATYNFFLWRMMWKRQPWRIALSPLLLVGVALFGTDLWDRGRLKAFSQRVLLGRRLHREEIAHHLEAHADEVLGRNVYPQALARIKAEREAGFTHVLATASYRLYVEAIAERLGFEHVIATDLHMDEEGRIRARIDGENVYDFAKLKRVEQWLKEEGLRREECFIRGYSDHVSDAPLLEFADEAYAVNAHDRLAELARRKQWRVIDWR
jgi:HAD superfamily hydrolase (TIGR01490 family)